MAIYNDEKKNGKLGDVIYSSWHGRPYAKKRPDSVANPRTVAQQRHRSAFAEISRLSSAMKNAHIEGLHYMAVREKLDTYSVFKRLNKDCCGAEGIDYSSVQISSGTVPGAVITSVEVDAQGVVRVAFDGSSMSKSAQDMFYIFVFCPDLRDGLFIKPVARPVGFVSAQILEEWKGYTLHLYAFMKDRKGRTSKTIYVGQYRVE